jgi:hypothetical protein
MSFNNILELVITGMAEYRTPAWSQSPRRKLRIQNK